MVRKFLFCVSLVTGFQFLSAHVTFAQKQKDDGRNPEPTVGAPHTTKYEPSPAFPYGRMNPKAPNETKQFSFMIGEFDCVDSVINPKDGKWIEFPAIWNAKYFLNGYGIQDQYWSPRFSTSNIRIFDSKEKKWKVTYFKKPGYGSGVWSGVKEGEDLVMRQGDDKRGSRLTFSSISKDGFEWVGESMKDGKPTPFWKSSCKRRR